MKITTIVLSAAMLLAATSRSIARQRSPPSRKPELGTIDGRIVDLGGGGVKDATIVADGGAGTGRAISGTSGHFSIAVPPGKYDLTATATGFKSGKVKSIEVNAGRVVTIVNWKLEQEEFFTITVYKPATASTSGETARSGLDLAE